MIDANATEQAARQLAVTMSPKEINKEIRRIVNGKWAVVDEDDDYFRTIKLYPYNEECGKLIPKEKLTERQYDIIQKFLRW